MHVVVVRTSSIGDVILAGTCLEIADHLKVKLTWLGTQPSLGLLEKSYPHHRFIEVPKILTRSFYKQSTSLDHKKIDGVLDLQNNLRSFQISKHFQRQGVLTFRCDKNRLQRGLLVARTFIRNRLSPLRKEEHSKKPLLQYQMMANAFASMLKNLQIPPSEIEQALLMCRPRIRLPQLSPNVSGAWLNSLCYGDWLAIAPGASHHSKRAPMQLWHEILYDLKTAAGLPPPPNFGLLVVGGENDKVFNSELLDSLAWKGPVLNLTGKLTLIETASAISKVRRLITNDSGLLHMAEAVDTPVLALFGPTSEEFGFAPWQKESRVFSSPIGCRPCSRHGSAPCRFADRLCFETINTKAVASAVALAFSKPPLNNQNESSV